MGLFDFIKNQFIEVIEWTGQGAERYSIDLKSGWNLAQGKIESDLRSEIHHHIGGDEVRSLRISTSYDAIKFLD